MEVKLFGRTFGKKQERLPEFRPTVPPPASPAETARLAQLPEQQRRLAAKRVKEIQDARAEADERIPDIILR